MGQALRDLAYNCETSELSTATIMHTDVPPTLLYESLDSNCSDKYNSTYCYQSRSYVGGYLSTKSRAICIVWKMDSFGNLPRHFSYVILDSTADNHSRKTNGS